MFSWGWMVEWWIFMDFPYLISVSWGRVLLRSLGSRRSHASNFVRFTMSFCMFFPNVFPYWFSWFPNWIPHFLFNFYPYLFAPFMCHHLPIDVPSYVGIYVPIWLKITTWTAPTALQSKCIKVLLGTVQVKIGEYPAASQPPLSAWVYHREVVSSILRNCTLHA